MAVSQNTMSCLPGWHKHIFNYQHFGASQACFESLWSKSTTLKKAYVYIHAITALFSEYKNYYFPFIILIGYHFV